MLDEWEAVTAPEPVRTFLMRGDTPDSDESSLIIPKYSLYPGFHTLFLTFQKNLKTFTGNPLKVVDFGLGAFIKKVKI
jgi:hypothetical protein